MGLLAMHRLPDLHAQFQRHFPKRRLQALWHSAEPRAYARTLTAPALIRVMLFAHLARLSGVRAIAERCGRWLGTHTPATISYALRRPSTLRLCETMSACLTRTFAPRPWEFVALDSMALTLPATQRHGCARLNRQTAGGGVLWAYRLEAPAGSAPLKILRITDGAWNDSRTVRGCELSARGPVYLMDRGFYALDLIDQWGQEAVRFIVRARMKDLVCETLEVRGPRRRVGDLMITRDAVVRLGGDRAKAHPTMRFVVAKTKKGEEIGLVSSLQAWTAERLLAAYRRRWQIERLHRFVKETVGLAHLYSFQRVGLRVAMHLALILVTLLLMAGAVCAVTVDALHQTLKTMRRSLGEGTVWKRNTPARKRWSP